MMFFSGGLAIYLFFKIRGRDISEMFRAPLQYYVVMLVGVGGYSILLNTAFKNAPAFEVNMLNYVWPVQLVLFSKLIKKQRLKLNEILGMALGFMGMCLIFIPPESQAFSKIGIGHLWVVIAATIWAFYSAYVSGKDFSAILLVPVMLLSGIISMFLHFAYEETILIQPVNIWIAVIALCITRFCFALWDYGMRRGDQVLLSSLSYFLPLISSLYFIAFGIMPTRLEVAYGGALIVTGCIVVNLHRIKILSRKNDAKI